MIEPLGPLPELRQNDLGHMLKHMQYYITRDARGDQVSLSARVLRLQYYAVIGSGGGESDATCSLRLPQRRRSAQLETRSLGRILAAGCCKGSTTTTNTEKPRS